MSDITVVVPVYNVEKYIEKCVKSLIAQTVKLKKIILIDDGSIDNSGIICDKFAEEYDNIFVIHQKNQGLSAARNVGMDLVDTEYIGFVDSDDYVENNMYEVLLRLLCENNADIAISEFIIEQANGDTYQRNTNNQTIAMNKKQALIELNSYKLFDMSVCTKLFRTKLFEGIRFPAGKLCEDYYVMCKLVAKADKVIYTAQSFYHYVQRGNSISRNTNVNLAPMDASIEQMKFYQKNFPDIAFVAETACAFSHMNIYSTYVRNGAQCPENLLKKCVEMSRKHLRSVLKNPYIPKIKKLQAIAFCYCRPVYKSIVKRRKHR